MQAVAVTIRLGCASTAGRFEILERLIAFGVVDLACTHLFGLVTGAIAADRIAALGRIDGIASVTRQGYNGYAQA